MTIRLGSTNCGELHQHLTEAGLTIASDELAAGTFGPSTELAVKHFQASHVDSHGSHLSVDGIVGKSTEWALEHPGATDGYIADGWRCEPSQVREGVRAAIQAAVGEIGNREDPDGSNSGPSIDKYGQKGQPWCAFFLSWAFNHLYGGSPFGVIGSAYGLKQWAEKRGRLLGDGEPAQAGDVGIILHAPTPRSDHPGHVGLIVGVDGKALSLVEGNSSNACRAILCSRFRFTVVARPVPL